MEEHGTIAALRAESDRLLAARRVARTVVGVEVLLGKEHKRLQESVSLQPGEEPNKRIRKNKGAGTRAKFHRWKQGCVPVFPFSLDRALTLISLARALRFVLRKAQSSYPKTGGRCSPSMGAAPGLIA